jgi:thiamine biosynthesis lipoprotein
LHRATIRGDVTPRSIWVLVALSLAPSLRSTVRQPHLYHHEASRMSMACIYAIEAYGPDADALARSAEEAFDEVDRIDRLMSHYRADSALSRINREAAQHPVAVDPELFDFIADAMRYSRDSDGAFDITVGPLMKAWGFFHGEGRVPAENELAAARRHVGGVHVVLNPGSSTIAFDHSGVELDLGGIAKGYAVDRAIRLLSQRQITAALISAGGSTLYGLGAPPGRDGWAVMIQDPVDARRVALTVQLKDRALSIAGGSEKSFEAGGVRYSHIMDPRTGRPVQGMLSVAVLASSGTIGDALDNALFVLGPERSQPLLNRQPGTEAIFFLPDRTRRWVEGKWAMGNGETISIPMPQLSAILATNTHSDRLDSKLSEAREPAISNAHDAVDIRGGL